MKQDWYKFITQLSQVEQTQCPICGEKSIDYLYVGDKKTEIGFLRLW